MAPGGSQTSESEKAEWADFLRAFFAKAETGLSRRPKQRGPAAVRKVPRLAASDLATALDCQVEGVLGVGLSHFLPQGSAEAVGYGLYRPPVLTMVTDEASSNLSMVHWLLWQAQVRLVHFRDPLHRQWNDATNAIKRSSVNNPVLLWALIPWAVSVYVPMGFA